ncbi:hypothetical protein NDK47_10540 [Brevibacillus ruminantium]|uniref:DUF4367 domain-containing protein n=1 Tax=Brevibacillus ruminantium TaxID=2950604 RepID=A0ABY4WLY3_9BACL|nr:hypothetical protein [Brevibacillus ruminantium]USG67679.1 hypothetical protein NDK47_10540 [Brevibacillus ruminantium]
MKLFYGAIVALALVVGFGSAVAYNQASSPSSKNHFAMTKRFTSTEEIVNDSQLIVQGSIPTQYREEIVDDVIYHAYQVQVNKVYSNLTNQEIEEGDTIELYRLIGFDSGKSIVTITEDDTHVWDEGEYLLFLNVEYDNEDKEVFVPNTPSQLFKLANSRGMFSKESNNNQFVNVYESEQLPKITEDELIQAIKK